MNSMENVFRFQTWGTIVLVLALAAAPACGGAGRQDEARRYELRGQVLAVEPDRSELMIKHDDIPGLMPGMTMAFKVKDEGLLDGRMPGDLVSGTLVVLESDAYLESLRKIGYADLTPAVATAASSGFELLRRGDEIPDAALIDQQGRTRRFSDWQGRAVALTFIYTRCPFPTFCPLMDRHFATLQRAIAEDDALRGRVQLVSVSFDPAYDTPEVMRRHAAELGADPASWAFVTGDRDDIDRFAARFGVSILRDGEEAADISHNLRTALVDGDGRLVKVYGGNEWSPEELLADLRALPARP
jgi:protein SCO1